jgi:hypothetical protein
MIRYLVILVIILMFHSPICLSKNSNTTLDFSWDNIQLYFHGRKSTAYTPDEIKYLAKFPLITLEKTTGYQTYSTTEEGSLQAARSIKNINPNTKILYYRNVLVHYPTYEVNSTLSTLSEPFLRNTDNGDVLELVGTNPGYDLTKPAVRKWWVDHCKYMSDQPEIDGIFVDGNVKVITPNYLLPQLGEIKKTDLILSYKSMLDSLNVKLSPQKMALGNLIRATLDNSGLEYMRYFDGTYLENFIGDRDYIAQGITAAQTVARQNKVVAFTFFIDQNLPDTIPTDANGYVVLSPENQKLFDFYLAIYLICAEQFSYFLVTENYDVNPGRNRFWLKRFAEYDYELGAPLARAITKGYTYTRKFKNADVTLNLNTMTGTITWLKSTNTDTIVEDKKIKYYSANKKIHLSSNTNQVVNIFNTIGVKIWSGNVGVTELEIPLPTGIYIIKENNKQLINF